MSWYEDIAKKGYLGNRAKIAAQSGHAPWSTEKSSDLDEARKKAIDTMMKKKKDAYSG